jgi:enoyl-[acyl-carrier protein] reductase II
VVAVGGIPDGRGMAAALALGAEGIGMRTRLSMTKESPLHKKTIEAQLKAGIEDTIYSNRFDGIYCRVLKTKSAEKAIKKGMNLPLAAIESYRIAKMMNMPYFKLALGVMLQGPKMMIQLAHFATAFDKIKAATEKGDLDYGVQLIGQCQGLINDVPTVKEVIERTVKEAKAIYQKNLKKF